MLLNASGSVAMECACIRESLFFSFFISRHCLTLDSIIISFVIIILTFYHRPEYWEQFISTIYELRFFSQILFLPIVLYVPALAFNQGKFKSPKISLTEKHSQNTNTLFCLYSNRCKYLHNLCYCVRGLRLLHIYWRYQSNARSNI